MKRSLLIVLLVCLLVVLAVLLWFFVGNKPADLYGLTWGMPQEEAVSLLEKRGFTSDTPIESPTLFYDDVPFENYIAKAMHVHFEEGKGLNYFFCTFQHYTLPEELVGLQNMYLDLLEKLTKKYGEPATSEPFEKAIWELPDLVVTFWIDDSYVPDTKLCFILFQPPTEDAAQKQ